MIYYIIFFALYNIILVSIYLRYKYNKRYKKVRKILNENIKDLEQPLIYNKIT